RRARAEKRAPRLPKYEGSFAPKPPPPPVYVAPEAPNPPADVVQTPAPAPARPKLASPYPLETTPPLMKPRAIRRAATAPSSEAPAQGPKMAALWPGLDATYRSYLGTPYV